MVKIHTAGSMIRESSLSPFNFTCRPCVSMKPGQKVTNIFDAIGKDTHQYFTRYNQQNRILFQWKEARN